MTATNTYEKLDFIYRDLSGTILVPPEYWPQLPRGAYIRYLLRGPEPFAERFKKAGKIIKLFTHDDGRQFMQVGFGTTTWSVCFDDLERIWKHYPYNAQIELDMIQWSLSDKAERIEELESGLEAAIAEIKRLRSRLDRLERSN